MAETLTLTAQPRDKVGKGSARAARRQGLVPAVIYGAKKDPQPITVKFNELVAMLNRGGFLSQSIELDVAGKSEQVLPRDIQLHPVTDNPQHVDFLRLAKGARVTVNVPVNFTGEEESPGLKRGGVLNVVRHEIELDVPATAIPEALEVSLAGYEINDQVRSSDITLPEGTELTITDRDFTIATISAPSALTAAEEAETEEEAEAAEEGEEGEAGAEEGEAEGGESGAGEADTSDEEGQ